MNFVNTERMQDPETAAWIMLRFAAEPLTFADLARVGDRPHGHGEVKSLLNTIRRWDAAGFISRTQNNPEKYVMPEGAKVLRDPPPAPPKPVQARPFAWRCDRQRIWSALRVLKTFDLVQICMAAEVTKPTALAYLGQLTRAGYLVRIATPRSAPPRWTAKRATGPKHPTISGCGRSQVIADPNTGTRFFLKDGVNHGS